MQQILVADTRNFAALSPEEADRKKVPGAANIMSTSLMFLNVKIIRTHQANKTQEDVNLGQISATQHSIDLVPETRPIRQQPYRSGMKS